MPESWLSSGGFVNSDICLDVRGISWRNKSSDSSILYSRKSVNSILLRLEASCLRFVSSLISMLMKAANWRIRSIYMVTRRPKTVFIHNILYFIYLIFSFRHPNVLNRIEVEVYCDCVWVLSKLLPTWLNWEKLNYLQCRLLNVVLSIPAYMNSSEFQLKSKIDVLGCTLMLISNYLDNLPW